MNETPDCRRLAGRHALVTAAAQGIGRAIALRLAEEGANVLALDVNGAALAALRHPRIRVQEVDAADGSALAAAVGDRAFDVLVNGVGWVHQGALLDCGLEEWRRSFALNVDSVYHATRLLLPAMRAARRGSIVNIASLSGVRGAPLRAAYSATKAAIVGITRSVSADYARDGVRCNAICPAMVDSPSLRERIAGMPDPEAARALFVSRHPAGRLGTPEDVAALAAYLASDESAFMTGAILQLDGGAGT